MSPVHAWLGAATVKLRFSRLGAIGRPWRLSVVDAETPLAASANTVLPHQLLHPLLAHADTLSTQCAPDARPAVSSAIGHIHGANLHHQCFRAQVLDAQRFAGDRTKCS